MRTWNPSAMQVLTGSKMYDWKVLSDEFLVSLIVSDERAEEIVRLYPEDEMTGRPGMFASTDKKLRANATKHVRILRILNADAEESDAIADQDEMESIAA
jgi:hypothetical protein